MKVIKYGFGAFLLLLILVAISTKQTPEPQQKPELEIPFDQMTPAQHLAKAKSIMQVGDPLSLSKGQLDEATRHMSAIPHTAPESKEAIAFPKQSLESAKEKYLERVRQKYTHDMEALLRGQGFDAVVTEHGDQLILTDDLLKDEGNRVQILATIRRIRGSQGLCDVEFRRVALGVNGMFSGKHIYSLGCTALKKSKTGE